MEGTKQTTVLPRRLVNKAHTQTVSSKSEKGQELLTENSPYRNQAIRTLRDRDPTAAIRMLAQADGTVSTAVYNYVQVAMSGYRVRAYNSSGHLFDAGGTQLAQSILSAMSTLYDYSKGYADKPTMEAVVEQSLREVVLTGALATELVLDQQRLPDRLQIVPFETLRWVSNGDGTKHPIQRAQAGGDDIDLNIPNFWVAESHKDASKAYASSMMEAALNTTYYYAEFIEDMRRAQRRGGHNRLVIKLNSDKVTAAAPADVRSDPTKMKTWMEDIRADVQTIIEAMEPEDALVAYDAIDAEMISSENAKSDYGDLVAMVSGLLATSLKTHPSILGLRLEGSQSLANTESLVFLKAARGIQRPVEDVLSRALTLAARLYGADVYVHFRFLPINLRPEMELEAFRTMHQARILELLSLGFITDDEAAAELDTGPRAPGAPPLSGTMFLDPGATSNRAKEASPNDDPQGRALQSDQPKKGGGNSQ
jgi:hypothetical protein